MKREGPIQEHIATLTEEIARLKDQLAEREIEREKLTALFFDMEQEISAELYEMVGPHMGDIEIEMTKLQKKLIISEAAKSGDVMDMILTDQLTFEQREVFEVVLGTHMFKIQHCLHAIHPQISCSAATLALERTRVRSDMLAVNIRHYEALRDRLDHEEAELLAFPEKRPFYEDAVEKFRNMLLVERRQRALQKELNQRKIKLEELRVLRMLALRAEKERQLQLAKEEAEAKARAKVETKSLRKQLVEATRKTVRGTKDYIRNMRYAASTAMDTEELRMAGALRNKAKKGGSSTDRSSGIRRLFFTKGNEETQQFQEQNDKLEERGLPFYTMVEKSPGNQIFIWYQMTYDLGLMVTNFEFSHDDPRHPAYKDWSEAGYEAVKYPGSHLVLWIEREPKRATAIGAINVSMSEQDEIRMGVDGYDKFDRSLTTVDFPDVYFWIKKFNKISKVEAASTNSIIAEVMKVKNLLKKTPNDKNLQALRERLNKSLEEAYEKEKSFEVPNPLTYAIDLMALDLPEFERWMRIFEQIDKEKVEYVTMEQMFDFFGEQPSKFAREIFYSADAFSEGDTVEFGDFVRAVGTFCFFGKEELLRFLFIFADTNNTGFITHEQFVDLLNILHPYDKTRAKAGLKELEITPGKEMEVQEFIKIHDKLPALLHPAFKLQLTIRDKTFGEEWWLKKLRKYKQVRHKIVAAGANSDTLAELEVQRFAEDQAREKRMAERSIQIKQETSQVRKALLLARQAIDEVS
jgi:Ca2+-binding EF-hand superfamily protein